LGVHDRNLYHRLAVGLYFSNSFLVHPKQLWVSKAKDSGMVTASVFESNQIDSDLPAHDASAGPAKLVVDEASGLDFFGHGLS
jgi:hypothetical protein